jgi:hypothetical protein
VTIILNNTTNKEEPKNYINTMTFSSSVIISKLNICTAVEFASCNSSILMNRAAVTARKVDDTSGSTKSVQNEPLTKLRSIFFMKKLNQTELMLHFVFTAFQLLIEQIVTDND